jgi:hypothetical membrane protein
MPRMSIAANPDGDSLARVTTWAVWTALLLAGVWFAATYSRDLPWLDDEWGLVPVLAGQEPLRIDALWTQVGEHRTVLPRLLFILSYKLTHGFRAFFFLQLFLAAALAALLIRAARRVRGRASHADAFFPVALLNWGQLITHLSGVRLQFTLGTVFLLLAAVAILALDRRWRLRTILGLFACAVALPLCGANGALVAPALALWLGALGVSRIRRPADAASRRHGWLLLALSGAALTLVALYTRGFFIPHWSPPVGVWSFLRADARFMSMAVGQAGRWFWPYSGVYAVIVLGATIALLVRRLTTSDADRIASSGLLAAAVAFACLALLFGVGRSAVGEMVPHNPRYAPAAVALVCLAYLAWLRAAPPAIGRLATGTLAVVACATFSYNTAHARDWIATGLVETQDNFLKAVFEGAEPLELAAAYVRTVHYADSDIPRIRRSIEAARTARMPPFDLARPEELERKLRPIYERCYAEAMPTLPLRARSPRLIGVERCAERDVVRVTPPAELHFALPADRGRLRTGYGVCPDADSASVTFRVTRTIGQGREEALWEQTLRPRDVPADRRLKQIEIALPRGEAGDRVVLRTIAGPDGEGRTSRPFWTGVRIEQTR